LDDALLLHQETGAQPAGLLGSRFPEAAQFRPQYFELAVLSVLALVLLSIMALAYLNRSPGFRRISDHLLFLMAAMAAFGLIVDLPAALQAGGAVTAGLGFVEDGGEMVIESLIVWYAFSLIIRNDKLDSCMVGPKNP